MLIKPILKKVLLAATATVTLLVALPSQAGQPYCPNLYGYQHDYRGDYRYGRPPVRKVVVVQHRYHHDRHDDRHDRRWDRRDDRWDRRDDRRDDDRYDRRYDR